MANQIEPSIQCLEFRLNFYHVNGIKNCPTCTKPQQPQQPKELTTEEQIIKYQQEVTLKQEKAKKRMLLNEIDIDDPETMMALMEKYADCQCCKGFVFNCDGQICEALGKCYCLQKDLQDQLND